MEGNVPTAPETRRSRPYGFCSRPNKRLLGTAETRRDGTLNGAWITGNIQHQYEAQSELQSPSLSSSLTLSGPSARRLRHISLSMLVPDKLLKCLPSWMPIHSWQGPAFIVTTFVFMGFLAIAIKFLLGRNRANKKQATKTKKAGNEKDLGKEPQTADKEKASNDSSGKSAMSVPAKPTAKPTDLGKEPQTASNDSSGKSAMSVPANPTASGDSSGKSDGQLVRIDDLKTEMDVLGNDIAQARQEHDGQLIRIGVLETNMEKVLQHPDLPSGAEQGSETAMSVPANPTASGDSSGKSDGQLVRIDVLQTKMAEARQEHDGLEQLKTTIETVLQRPDLPSVTSESSTGAEQGSQTATLGSSTGAKKKKAARRKKDLGKEPQTAARRKKGTPQYHSVQINLPSDLPSDLPSGAEQGSETAPGYYTGNSGKVTGSAVLSGGSQLFGRTWGNSGPKRLTVLGKPVRKM
eukprot:GHVQ01024321.1.p1 GENE.GHVQ01024321.1~~GHVQ01024321.1.p1  ORF type:complete len:464 (+),score=70.09 GHVQ01024321.1:149-1540(+)